MQLIASKAQRAEMSGIIQGGNKKNDSSELKTKLEMSVNDTTIG